MPRIFLPLQGDSGLVRITGDRARYLTKVLRCREGDELHLLDGKGRSFQSIIRGITRREVTVEITGHIPYDTESPLYLILIQAILKGEKMDIVVQKTTELGIKEIYPVVTERCQVRETARVERWLKIAEEASRQSGRTEVPVIHNVSGLYDLMDGLNADSKGFIFWEGGHRCGGVPLSEAVKTYEGRKVFGGRAALYLLTGPEGGFSVEEVERARSRGFVPVTLGRRILRAETAAIVSTALVQFLLGDMG